MESCWANPKSGQLSVRITYSGMMPIGRYCSARQAWSDFYYAENRSDSYLDSFQFGMAN